MTSLRSAAYLLHRSHRDERGQTLPLVLSLITFLFLVGGALALHASTALRATVANEAQADDLHAADAGMELGIWWHRQGSAGNPPNITVNGLTVATTVSVAAGPCDTSTPVYLTGFEHGAISAAGGGLFAAVGGATADAAVTRNGAYSLRIADPAGSAAGGFWVAGGNVLVVRFAIRLSSLPAADVASLASIYPNAGSELRLGYRLAGNRLTLRFGAGAAAVSTTSVAAGTWYVIDMRATVNTNPRTGTWQLNGVAQPAASIPEAGSTILGFILGSGVAADIYTANYDDLLMSQTSADYPVGDGAITALRPTGMGTSVNSGNFRNSAGQSPPPATSWQQLDDAPMTSTADYLFQTAISAGSYLEYTMADTTTSCISGVSGVVAYTSSAAGVDDGKTSVMVGATERVVYDGDMGVGAALTYRGAIVSPTAAPWTTAAVNGLIMRIGFSTDVTPSPRWQALLLEMATGAATAGTVTVTATGGSSTVTTTYTDSGAAAPVLSTWTTTK